MEIYMKKIITILVIIAVAGIAVYFVKARREAAVYNNPGFAYGNGRLEATEINIASKLSGKIENILVNEGDFVKKGQHLAQMQTNVLAAELAQAKAMIKVKEGELAAAKAGALQAQSEYRNAKLRYDRVKELWEKNAASKQTYENDQMLFESAEAGLAAAKAKIQQAEAAIVAAKADADRIQADIDDSRLEAPRDGRIQYRIAEPGEVLSAGGKVLNQVDLSDVYMTFFLPEGTAGKVKIGADVRIVLDALPDIPIPAKISYVASTAQFTPKTVETKVERQKLMFRVKARIAPELLKKYIEYVKTGLPGVAWVQINPEKPWPAHLQLKGAEKK
ncbi:MAG: efflux RND transporter periplasmic adaptor subunit [Lentisphaeria bacterium]|nr:efflux RND transporter periplasmic adaptor subunit [Lentisphaeria bacterium]